MKALQISIKLPASNLTLNGFGDIIES